MNTDNNNNNNNNSTEIKTADAKTVNIPVLVINDLLGTANYIDESEIVTQAIGVIDCPGDHDMANELVKAAARLYADVHFLKSEMNKVLAPLVRHLQ